MPRLARVVATGVPHHITHRGNHREPIFFSDADRKTYLTFLQLYAQKARLEIWAHCLMDNHVHLIAVPRRADSLARGVGLAHRRFARWQNAQRRWSGHLFANRFFSTALDDRHLWAAVRHVERNPVRAKIVRRAENHRWSRARHYTLGGLCCRHFPRKTNSSSSLLTSHF